MTTFYGDSAPLASGKTTAAIEFAGRAAHYETGSPQPPLTTPKTLPYTDDEMRVLIDYAVRQNVSRLKQEMRELLAEHAEQLLLKVERMIDHRVSMTQATPTQQKRPLPDLENVTRMRFQLFENFRKLPEKRTKNQAFVQLKLEVWIEKQHNGYWLIPVDRPDRTEGRKRIKEIMPQVDELGRDQIKYAGKLGNNLEVYVGHNNRLTCDMANGSNSIHLDVHRFAQRPVPGLSHRHRTEGHARYGSVIYTYDEKGMTLYAKAA